MLPTLAQTIALNAFLMAVNFLMAVYFLARSPKNFYFGINVFFWLSAALTFVLQMLADSSEWAAGLGFSSAFISSLIMKALIENHVGRSTSYRPYVIFMAVALLSESLMFKMTGIFVLLAFPICLAVILPACIAATKALRIPKESKPDSVFNTILVITLCNGVHVMDFPFGRFNEGIASFAFMVAALLLTAYGAVIPMLALEKAHDEFYESKLQIMHANAVAHTIANTAQMIAHDLQKPFHLLRIIMHQIQSPGGQSPLPQKFISHIVETTDYVENLIGDLLVAGNDRINKPEVIDLMEITQATWNQQPPSRTQKAHLNLDFNKTDLLVDRTKALRLFSNLFSNALEASPGEQAVIWVGSKSIQSNGRPYWRITIGNEGSYIPPDRIRNLFTRFHTEGKTQGTGLGLAICYEIVKSHDGEIECHSDTEKGTEFVFTLPAAPEHEI